MPHLKNKKVDGAVKASEKVLKKSVKGAIKATGPVGWLLGLLTDKYIERKVLPHIKKRGILVKAGIEKSRRRKKYRKVKDAKTKKEAIERRNALSKRPKKSTRTK